MSPIYHIVAMAALLTSAFAGPAVFVPCDPDNEEFLTPDYDNIYTQPTYLQKGGDIELFYQGLVNAEFTANKAVFNTHWNGTPLNVQDHPIDETQGCEGLCTVGQTFAYHNGFFVPGIAPTGEYVVKLTILGYKGTDTELTETGCVIAKFALE